MKRFLLILVVFSIAFSITTLPTIQAQEANLADSCVESYDPDVDYFPDKTEINHATGLEITYFNHYKVIDIPSPWAFAEEGLQYVLVQCGTPTPEGYEDAFTIEVPVDSMIALATVYLPHLEELGILDRLIGLDTSLYVSTPAILEKAVAGELVEVGSGSAINIEVVLNTEPGIVMTSGSGSADWDAHPVLLDAGVPVAINAEQVETSPLGRTEWLKYIAAFFNREAEANRIYDEIVQEYDMTAALLADVDTRPTVFLGVPFDGSWYIPGGNSYIAHYLADAGAEYLWKDDTASGALPTDFEVVFDRAADADFWINTGLWLSLDDALGEDDRFAEFAAFENEQVYNYTRRVTESGGYDFFEGGVANPHLVLADLIAIFHPDLLPDHELYFYEQLTLEG